MVPGGWTPQSLEQFEVWPRKLNMRFIFRQTTSFPLWVNESPKPKYRGVWRVELSCVPLRCVALSWANIKQIVRPWPNSKKQKINTPSHPLSMPRIARTLPWWARRVRAWISARVLVWLRLIEYAWGGWQQLTNLNSGIWRVQMKLLYIYMP